MSNNTVKSSGVGFLGFLTLIFIGAKLFGAIAWSWWWVLSPIIVPWTVGFIVAGVIATFAKDTTYKVTGAIATLLGLLVAAQLWVAL